MQQQRNPSSYIQWKVIAVAKERVFDPARSIRQIVYELGFKYPPHFNRLSKQQVGQSPQEYRMLHSD
ncbi:helix-turn-helix domain-containing protein [Larkinella sp. GY13]|uniref:helix-turn-helix domain-containing protein n=1 Tax=Larkinella sp. GY13 TaxID=3453720 RepID=UPI003EED4752